GSPVRHSLSPAIHNAAFLADGLDWVYVAFEVAEGEGAAAVEAMRTLGLGGLSVTMPHKAGVAAAVDVASEAVRKLEACNCVYWSEGRLHGDNTDGDGLVEALLHEAGVSVAGRTVSVLGAGGAARSIVEAVGRAGAAAIHVWARSETSAATAAELSGVGSVGPIEMVRDADIVINATSVGMAGGPNPNGIPVPADLLGQHQIVQDIVYEPRETPLMTAARQRGATVLGGVEMLVHQAARQYTHWTGQPAPLGTMRRAAQDGE
ncbi:MAG: shikimate dehydrogenase, partial [Acidimicrobiia bacterium]|nr:shikimate dehydrogenase [Acidimicrobiia bacterium]